MHPTPYGAVFGEELGRIAICRELEAERIAASANTLLTRQVSPPNDLEGRLAAVLHRVGHTERFASFAGKRAYRRWCGGRDPHVADAVGIGHIMIQWPGIGISRVFENEVVAL